MFSFILTCETIEQKIFDLMIQKNRKLSFVLAFLHSLIILNEFFNSFHPFSCRQVINPKNVEKQSKDETKGYFARPSVNPEQSLKGDIAAEPVLNNAFERQVVIN